MKKQERITNKVKADKELLKLINKHGFYYGNDKTPEEIEQIKIDCFIDHASRYIKAIKERRVICNIASVSRSGMSRTMKFVECAKNHRRNEHNYLNFMVFFRMVGHNPDRNGYFRVNGCGMDMVFATNYNIIHKLHRLGFISKKQCNSLAQNTPHVM